MQNELNIVSHNLWDFLQSIQQGVLDGYVLSDKNVHFPQAFISLYTCTLVKKESMVGKYDMPTEFVATPPIPVTLADMVASEIKKSAGRPSKNK